MEMLGLGMQKEKIGFRMKLSWNDTNFHSTYVCHTIKNRFECNNSKSCALNDFLLFSIQIHKSRIFVYVNHCHFTHTLSIWFFWFLCNFNRCPMQTAEHIKGLYSGFFISDESYGETLLWSIQQQKNMNYEQQNFTHFISICKTSRTI